MPRKKDSKIECGVFASTAMGDTNHTFILEEINPRELELHIERTERNDANGENPRNIKLIIKKDSLKKYFLSREGARLLFDYLIGGEIRRVYDSCSGGAVALRKELQLKIRFDLEQQEIDYLYDFPWEVMCDRNDYLSIHKKTPIIRYIILNEPKRDIRVDEEPMNLLIVAANPPSTGKLRLDLELDKLQEHVDDYNYTPYDGALFDDYLKRVNQKLSKDGKKRLNVEILAQKTGEPGDKYVVGDPSFEVFRDKLADNKYDFLHFMGHGAYDGVRTKGALVFEKNGALDIVESQALGLAIRNATRLRLVFLNACDTSRTGKGQNALSDAKERDDDAVYNPFEGVAISLVKAGVPAVIAMQMPIADDTACDFADTFYKRLLKEDSIEKSLTLARQAIFDEQSFEWATPVLFERFEEGNLMSSPDSVPTEIHDPPVPAKKQVCLVYLEEDAGYADELFKYLEKTGIEIFDPDFDKSENLRYEERRNSLSTCSGCIVINGITGHAAPEKRDVIESWQLHVQRDIDHVNNRRSQEKRSELPHFTLHVPPDSNSKRRAIDRKRRDIINGMDGLLDENGERKATVQESVDRFLQMVLHDE